MSYQVLARKWRPSNFDDVLGQGHVIRSLKNSVATKRLAQSYLLSGTRGIGKTTIARVLAKALRCTNLGEDKNPCNKCEACLDVNSGSSMDVLEVDGASNNSVENVREIISTLQYIPTFGEKRVVIIDEVHMLSISAFNALLKTLEEPPAHVVFIFATTEPHKIPKTILSRVQRFDLRNIRPSDMKEQLNKISQVEGFSFSSNEVVNTLCSVANGSMRDLLSIIEQLLLIAENNVIDHHTVRLSLGIIEKDKVIEIVDRVYSEDLHKLADDIDEVIGENLNLEHLLLSICEEFFARLESKLSKDSSEEHFLFETFSKEASGVLGSVAPFLSFKALMFKMAKRSEYFKRGGLSIKNKEAVNTPQREVEERKVEVVGSSQVEEYAALEAIEKSQSIHDKNSDDVSTPLTELLNQETPTDDGDSSLENTEPEPEMEVESKPAEQTTAIEDIAVVKTWESFSGWLIKKSPALSSTIEQGNFVTEIDSINNEAQTPQKISLKFEEDSSVFYEHMIETNGVDKLKKYLSEFFNLSEELISLHVDLLDSEDTTDFKSIANLKEDEYNKELKSREDSLRDDNLVKLAQEMFDSKLDKVIPNKEL